MVPFPSIKQFRDVIREIRRRAEFMGLDGAGEPIINPAPVMPTLRFRGSVKMHGTNAAVVFAPTGTVFQSRERELSETADNAGFCNHMMLHGDALRRIANGIEGQLALVRSVDNVIAMYGEWCGGNIQKGVGLAGLPKMFVVFAIRVNGEWKDIEAFDWITDSAAGIYNVVQFEQFDMTIDFERPEIAQNWLGAITELVEARCPVAASFGQEGIGEGVVWRCIENPTSDFWFKVKGEKHSATKVKTLAAVDVEAVTKIRDFVDMAVTPARLEQGLQNLVGEQQKPFDMSSMGDFIRWVYGDVMKEECDTVAASGFDPKKLGGPIANASKRWFVERLNAASMPELVAK